MATPAVFIYLIIILNFRISGCQGNCDLPLDVGILPASIIYTESGHHTTRCHQWSLYSQALSRIKLTVFYANLGSTDCSDSYIEVRDGTVYSRKIATICNSTSTSIVSSGRYMMIIYHQGTGHGIYKTASFSLQYAGYDTSACSSGYRITSSDVRYILPPPYQGHNSLTTDCQWLLDTADTKHVVSIQFIATSSRRSAYNCQYRYVELYDGSDRKSTLLGSWCGNATSTKQSTGRYLYIRFLSARPEANAEFKIAYSTLSVGLQTTQIGAIVGGVAAAIVFVICVCCVIFCCRKDRNKNTTPNLDRSAPSTSVNVNIYAISIHNRPRSDSSSSDMSSSPPSPPSPLPSPSSHTEAPPPAYDDLVHEDTSSPPSYLEVVIQESIEIDRANHTAQFVQRHTTDDFSNDTHRQISSQTENSTSNQSTHHNQIMYI